MKQILFTNWHFMRFLRVALALFLFYNAMQTSEWFFMIFGIFFLFQAVFNMGCGTNSCKVNYNKNK